MKKGKGKRICETCDQAGSFDYAPTPSQKDDGVWCQCREIAQELDALDQYEKYGAVLIWRVERLDKDAECEHWTPKLPSSLFGH